MDRAELQPATPSRRRALLFPGLGGPPGSVRLRTLVLIRWVAVAGQTAAVLGVHFLLGFDLPLAPALGVIAISAWVNIFFMLSRPSQGPIPDWEAAAQLAYDIVQLALLLALTGGLANPFVMLFVAPVAVSAIMLRPAITVALGALSYACVGILSVWRLPLPWTHGATYEPPALYLVGLAAAVLVGLGFTTIYAWRIAMEEERLNAALSAVQVVLSREQQLSALGGLAAAAAHELGTPLATIHLVAKELERQAPADSPLLEDLQLLVSQSERCRGILKQLASRKEEGDAMHERMSVRALLEDVAQPHRGLGARIEIVAEPDAGIESAEPQLRRSPEILHGLGNLVENAVGFASGRVEIEAKWSPTELRIAIRDDGPGFSAGVLPRLGEPYVSERGDEPGGGLGLGFFIAKTLLERTGARVTAVNRAAPRSGAVVRATWRRSAIEAKPMR